MKVLFTLHSKNKKLGSMPAAMVESKSCPDNCGLKKNGCYSEFGNVRLHWIRLDKSKGEERYSWKHFIRQIKALFPKQIWRMSVAGDLPGTNNNINKRKMLELINANKGRSGFGYTHKPVIGKSKQAKHNRDLIRLANRKNFTINLSADNLALADSLSKLNIAPVVAIVPLGHPKHSLTPEGRKVLVCPETTIGLTCDRCRLCANPKRKSIIAFISHGVMKKSVSARATLPIVE